MKAEHVNSQHRPGDKTLSNCGWSRENIKGTRCHSVKHTGGYDKHLTESDDSEMFDIRQLIF